MIGIENAQRVGVFFRVARKVVMAGLVMPFSALTKAEVTLDGSLGPTGPIPLVNQNFEIPDTVGQTVGPNLFHSFGLFNINTGESATFTGPSSIENVLGRVTGGSSSFIDGLLRTQFENASPNLFLLNPAGVLFGPNASLDVQGSFHVSTADYLKLGDGGRFEATNPENSVLTVAPPEAFGFLGERQPAGIAVQGSLLQVPAGETLSVVGGDIRIADGSLYAPGGRIDMVSVASPGEVLPNAPDLGVASFERLGRIEVSHSSSSEHPRIEGNIIGNVDTSGEGGGRIFIRGGQFTMDYSRVQSVTRGGKNGGIVSVKAGDFQMRNGALISTATFGSGRGGDVRVEADHVLLSGDESFTTIIANTFGRGDAGTVTVKAGDFQMRNGAEIGTSTRGSGRGGNVRVEADHVLLSGSDTIIADTFGRGDAGTVIVKAGDFQMRNGAEFVTSTSGPGRGGDVRAEADHVLLDGFLTTIIANTFGRGDAGTVTVKAGDFQMRNGAGIVTSTSGPGRGGDVRVEAGDLEMRNGALISTTTFGSGREGDVRVEADHVLLDGDESPFPIPPTFILTGIQADTRGDGNAGSISIEAGDLELTNDAEIISGSGRLFSDDGFLEVGQGNAGTIDINADNITLFDSRISTSTLGSGAGGVIKIHTSETLTLVDRAVIEAQTGGSGAGGNINIEATDIKLNRDAGIFAGSSGTGLAGQLFIKALDNLRLVNGSQISVATTEADAGDITLEVGNLLHLSNDSRITTSAAGGTGKGGNITLNSVLVVLDQGSSIIANAERGQAGNILIRILGGGALFRSPDSRIEAASELGIEGSVVIDAPDTDIIAGFAGLPANFLDAATVLTQLCAGRSGANVSSLVVRKYEVLPDSPYALRVQLPRAMPTSRTAKQSRAPHTYYAGSPLPPMISCLGNG